LSVCTFLLVVSCQLIFFAPSDSGRNLVFANFFSLLAELNPRPPPAVAFPFLIFDSFPIFFLVPSRVLHSPPSPPPYTHPSEKKSFTLSLIDILPPSPCRIFCRNSLRRPPLVFPSPFFFSHDVEIPRTFFRHCFFSSLKLFSST